MYKKFNITVTRTERRSHVFHLAAESAGEAEETALELAAGHNFLSDKVESADEAVTLVEELDMPVVDENDHQKVLDWLRDRSNGRELIHSPGSFSAWVGGRMSCLWGNPPLGYQVEPGLRVVVCTPSARHKGDPLIELYDFQRTDPHA